MSKLPAQYTQNTQGCRTLSKETRRLFFALDLSEEHNSDSRNAVLSLKQSLAAYGRPVPDDNLHITLAFLGNVDPIGYRSLCEAADKIHAPSLRVMTHSTGFFRTPSILWLGLADNPELSQLAFSLQGAATSIPGHKPDNKFVPHISLIRKAHAPKQTYPLEIPFYFRRFGIYASVNATQDQGVRYECLNHWALTP